MPVPSGCIVGVVNVLGYKVRYVSSKCGMRCANELGRSTIAGGLLKHYGLRWLAESFRE